MLQYEDDTFECWWAKVSGCQMQCIGLCLTVDRKYLHGHVAGKDVAFC